MKCIVSLNKMNGMEISLNLNIETSEIKLKTFGETKYITKI